MYTGYTFLPRRHALPRRRGSSIMLLCALNVLTDMPRLSIADPLAALQQHGLTETRITAADLNCSCFRMPGCFGSHTGSGESA